MKIANCGTWKTGQEIRIPYPKNQRFLYQQKDPECIYPQFPRQVGANKGNFVEMVARDYFEKQGYDVECYYYLVRNRVKREKMSGFHKIIKLFGEKRVRKLIAKADNAFLSIGKRKAAGDPDLFVYNQKSKEYFFVEVKDLDQITDNQRILFPLIQKHLCPVFIARVVEEDVGQ